MDTQEYEAYRKSVERGLEGLTFTSTGPCPGCPDCGLEDVTDMDSPEYEEACNSLGEEFSWQDCDCCGSSLGGTREPMHGYLNDELWHGSICVDCVYYLNYGQLDDTTMMDIEAS